MPGRTWVFDPHSGGNKIPDAVRRETVAWLEKHAAAHYAGLYTRLDIRFRGALCYIDAFTEPEEPSKALLEATGETREQFLERVRTVPLHLCRLRYFAPDRWSLAFYTYSNERYEPCVFRNGTFLGTPEEGFDAGAAAPAAGVALAWRFGLCRVGAGVYDCHWGTDVVRVVAAGELPPAAKGIRPAARVHSQGVP